MCGLIFFISDITYKMMILIPLAFFYLLIPEGISEVATFVISSPLSTALAAFLTVFKLWCGMPDAAAYAGRGMNAECDGGGVRCSSSFNVPPIRKECNELRSERKAD